MFTGITQGLFPVTHVDFQPGLIGYRVRLNENLLQGLQLGASISIDGVCQTVVAITGLEVSFHAMQETCRKTTLSTLKPNQKVSIERSITFGSEIGGHLLSGHVQGMVLVSQRAESENNLRLILQGSKEMMPYLFNKGFVGINGSSLTVNAVDLVNQRFQIDLIPHTLLLTDFGNKKIGDKLNIELDATTVVIVDTVRRRMKDSALP
jgi:riboflavin synthase